MAASRNVHPHSALWRRTTLSLQSAAMFQSWPADVPCLSAILLNWRVQELRGRLKWHFQTGSGFVPPPPAGIEADNQGCMCWCVKLLTCQTRKYRHREMVLRMSYRPVLGSWCDCDDWLNDWHCKKSDHLTRRIQRLHHTIKTCIFPASFLRMSKFSEPYSNPYWISSFNRVEMIDNLKIQ